MIDSRGSMIFISALLILKTGSRLNSKISMTNNDLNLIYGDQWIYWVTISLAFCSAACVGFSPPSI
jgi:hypothetical protein